MHPEGIKDQRLYKLVSPLPGLVAQNVIEHRITQVGVTRFGVARFAEVSQVCDNIVTIKMRIEILTVAKITNKGRQHWQIHVLPWQTRGMRHQLQQRNFFRITA